LIKEKTAELGIPQRSFNNEEILRRLLFASVDEACKILDEGKACRASAIDVMWLNGFGFPRHRGGLMYWADGIGVAEVYRQIQAWHQQYGERWAPAPSSAVPPKAAPRYAKPSPAAPCNSASEPSGHPNSRCVVALRLAPATVLCSELDKPGGDRPPDAGAPDPRRVQSFMGSSRP
jgi:hypothetical protein